MELLYILRNYMWPSYRLTHANDPVVVLQVFVILGLLGVSCVLFIKNNDEQAKFWKAHPIDGAKTEWFWWTRVVARSVFGSKAMVDHGYKTYSSKNKIFGSPSIDRGAFVVIPPQQLKSVYDRAEDIVDAHWTQSENIQAKYTIGDPEIFSHSFHVNVIRNQITRNLNILTPAIVDELSVSLRKHWGTDKENYKKVPAWPSCLRIIAEAVNRVFVGKPHCRDEKFLEATKWHAEWVFSNAFIIHATPWFIRPLVGSLIYLYGKIVRRRCLKPILPLIQQRLSYFLEQQQCSNVEHHSPRDGLQWLIEEAWKTGKPEYMDPVRIGHRLLILNFVSMHTTSFTLTNALQDIFSHKESVQLVEDLRNECTRVLKSAGGDWTQDAVNKLHLLDSTIRESMRVSSFSILALPRRVVAEGGITIENDTHIPKGIYLATPMDAIHLDPNFYVDPVNFYPFRFCRPDQIESAQIRASYESKNPSLTKALQGTIGAQGKAKSTVTLDETFLSFGFGRNACPGRFFALHEIKLAMALILLNYDIEHFVTRPDQFKIMWVQLPNDRTMLKVKSRN